MAGTSDSEVTKFNRYVIENGERGDSPFVCRHGRDDVAYYLKFNVDPTILTRIYEMFEAEFGCKTCADRAVFLSPLIGKRGLIFCKNLLTVERTRTQEEARTMMVKSLTNTDTNRPCSVVLVPSNLKKKINTKMGSPYLIMSESKNEQPAWFHHYSTPLYKSSNLHNLTLIQLAMDHYMPNVYDLLMKFYNSDGLMESLLILFEIIGDIAYASEYKGPIVWLYGIMNKIKLKDSNKFADLDYVDRMNILVTGILDGPIQNKGRGGEIIPLLPFYHSCNGMVMTWLVNGRSEKALRQLIKENCSPDNHKRSSGEVSEGMVKNAMRILGADTPEGEAKLYTKVHTVREIEELGAVKIVSKQETSSSGLFASGLKNIVTKKKKKKDPCGLASRIGKERQSNMTYPTCGWNGMTIQNLYDMAKSGEIHSLEIKPDVNKSLEYAYTAKTGIDPELLRVPRLWGFTRNTSLLTHKVSHVYVLTSGKYKIGMFILPQSQTSPIIESKIKSNCMFPEFFNPNCQRELRKVVEKLNKKNKVGIDKYKHNSFGIGVNIDDDDNNLHSNINVKINEGVVWIKIRKFC